MNIDDLALAHAARHGALHDGSQGTKGKRMSGLQEVRVYVAGPLFGSGRSSANVHRAIKTAEALRDAGLIPFVPHLFHFWDTVSPHGDVNYWLDMDQSWLAMCDAMIVLPGESPGARLEEEWAAEYGISVFHIDPHVGLRATVQEMLSHLHHDGGFS